ncbi:MAG TPA: YggU family protein [Deltaproteobacteria bacterium]|nr:YggU family protein [Deltaproteobacteria bacterium]
MIRIKDSKKGFTFAIHVTPNASRNQITGFQDGALKIKITAQAREGEANAACIKFLSKFLSLPKKQIQIIAGEKSRQKIILIKDAAKNEVQTRLNKIS